MAPALGFSGGTEGCLASSCSGLGVCGLGRSSGCSWELVPESELIPFLVAGLCLVLLLRLVLWAVVWFAHWLAFRGGLLGGRNVVPWVVLSI